MNLTILAFEIIVITLFLTAFSIKAFNVYQTTKGIARYSKKSILNN